MAIRDGKNGNQMTTIDSEDTSINEVWIDPPSGWTYGFPKKMPKDTEDSVKWLIDHGYPEHLIKFFGEHFHVRMWNVDTSKKT